MIQSINFRHIGVLTLLFLTAFFTSCQKDNLDKITTPNTNTQITQNARNIANSGHVGNRNGNPEDDCGCYAAFDDIDWEASEEEIWAQIDAVLATMTDEEVDALLTPVCTADGEIYDNACIAECEGVTDFEACTDEDFEDIFGDWEGECDGYDDCFEINYPIDVLLPDGTTQTANDDEELETIIFEYYEQNPNDTLLPTLNYPVEVILEDGTTQTVNNDEELEALLDECEDGEYDDCFTVNYPITVILPDNTTATVNSDEELEDAIDEWYNQNPTSEEYPTFEYPISVTLDDGTVQEINSDEELDALFEDCYGFKGGDTDKLIIGGGKGATTKAVLKGNKSDK